MNKKKKVIIGVLAVILVAAVGYAIFSDTLTIKGTATAQGNFNLTYSCEVVGDVAGNCSVEGNTVTTTSTLSKPNETVMYIVTVTNTGTIPAVLKTVDSPNNFKSDGASFGDEVYADLSTGLAAQYMVCDDEDLGECNYGAGDSATESANITIQPSESKYIAVLHVWGDLGDSQPEIPDDGASIDYNLTFGFEQITS
jgi:NADPH:quinone reductase-like Zn-dependent oxidoreductase